MTYSNNNYNDQTDDNRQTQTDQTTRTTEQTTEEVAPPYTVFGDDISNGESVTFATLQDIQGEFLTVTLTPMIQDFKEIIDKLPDDFKRVLSAKARCTIAFQRTTMAP